MEGGRGGSIGRVKGALSCSSNAAVLCGRLPPRAANRFSACGRGGEGRGRGGVLAQRGGLVRHLSSYHQCCHIVEQMGCGVFFFYRPKTRDGKRCQLARYLLLPGHCASPDQRARGGTGREAVGSERNRTNQQRKNGNQSCIMGLFCM